MDPTPTNACCLNCNYPLHSLPATICPECGKPFNPADARTMNLGRVPGPIARGLLRHTGSPILLLGAIATIALFIISGLPRIVPPRLTDTLYSLDRSHWNDYARTTHDKAYATTLLLWLFLLGYYFIRIVLRLIAQRRYQLRLPPPPRAMLRRSLFAIALLCSIAIVLFAWPIRVTRAWIASSAPPPPAPPGMWIFVGRNYTCPINLAQEDQAIALRSVVTGSTAVTERNAAMNLYIRFFHETAPPVLANIADSNTTPEFRATAIHLLSLYHRADSAALFKTLLDDPNPAVRAAAADAIDILRGPGLPSPYYSSWSGPTPELATKPPIGIANLLSARTMDANYNWPLPPPLPAISFDPATRAKIEQIMMTGATSDQRQAAARALINWPPSDYQLRAAEWGVWLGDSKGDPKLTQSFLDEIPPFVHRIGNSYDSLTDHYMNWTGGVFKPILHLTSTSPLAVDMEVYIDQGRPAFAFPRPDDLSLSHQTPPTYRSSTGLTATIDRDDIRQLDDPSMPGLPDLHEGYPWMRPEHRLYELFVNRPIRRPSATSLGLRWQSLIVLPKQAAWMKPPAVPADAKYKWWSALRDVPSCYVSSRDESERFLYYDGPTLAKPPLVAALNDDKLILWSPFEIESDRSNYNSQLKVTFLKQPDAPNTSHREGFFIRVKAGQPTALRYTLDHGNGPMTQVLPHKLPILANDVIPQFKKILTDYGLTPEESQGLIDAWKTQLFHTNGQRLLLRLSAHDYDTLCPISIKPPPTTLVRLGFVLTEFP